MRRHLFLTISVWALVSCGSSQENQRTMTPAAGEKTSATEQAPSTAEQTPRAGDQSSTTATRPSSRAEQQPMMEDNADTPSGMMKMSGICPTQLAGTNVAVDEISGGVALRFTGSEDVMELRRRVAHMAEMQDYRSEMMGGSQTGHMQGAKATRGQGQPHRRMMMPAAIARSENIDGGAMLVLTPRDPDDLSQLRRKARQMSQQMTAGQCPMLAPQTETKEPSQGSD